MAKKKVVKKKFSGKTATKKAVQRVAKTTAKQVARTTAQEAANKSVKKQLATSKKQLATSKKAVARQVKKNISQDQEIAKLKDEVAKLIGKSKGKSKKVNSKRISEYNLFIRKQIKSGYTFVQAVREWNRYQALMSKDKRRPSAYNQFIGSQMRLGKTFAQAVALWKLAKAGKLGKKGSTRTVTKTVVRTRTIKSKPTIKYRTRTIKVKPEIITKIRRVATKPRVITKTVVRTRTIKSKPEVITKIRRVATKPRIITKIQYRNRSVPVEKTRIVKQDVDYDKIKSMFSTALSNASLKSDSKSVSVTSIKKSVVADEEEIAFNIVQTYFKEIARFGFKKQLTLDEIIDAYIYSLARVKRNEAAYVAQRVKESGIRK